MATSFHDESDLATALAAIGRALLSLADKAAAPAAAPAAPTGLLSGPELDRALGISASTRNRLVRFGVLPHEWVGDRRRFDLEACRVALRERGRVIVPTSGTAATPKVVDVDVVAARGGLRRVGR